MFRVETIDIIDRSCPNGHAIANGRMPQDWKIAPEFCHLCGAPLSLRAESYDAALCDNCNNLVVPSWNYCPYCGV